jgi:hypothetical protein
VKTPDDHLVELKAWIRLEAENLPYDVKQLVLDSIDHRNAALVCRELTLLMDAGKLPASWGPSIISLCGWAF